MDRRKFIKSTGLAIPIVSSLPMGALALIETNSHKVSLKSVDATQQDEKADYTIHIGTGLVEVGPQHIISTTLYNGRFPGPLLRFKEGQKAVVDIYNNTDTPEQLQ